MNIKEIAAGYGAGWSLRELAAKDGIDKKTVALQLKKSSVVLRLPQYNIRAGPLA
jgi:hypothetical protein